MESENMKILNEIERYQGAAALPMRFQRTIQSAVTRLKDEAIPEMVAIILFGSIAKGKLRTGSDVDICIVTRTKLTDRIYLEHLTELMEEMECPVDLSFLSLPNLDSDDTFTKDLRKYGKLLWQCDGSETEG